jgi:ABC-type Zn2+ transport system substrate-binding protein/surface adhesin
MGAGGSDQTTMSDHDARVPDQHGSAHEVGAAYGSTTDHGEGHGDDDHAHDGEPLGPVDWTMWGVGVIGVVLALVISAAFVVATGFAFNA